MCVNFIVLKVWYFEHSKIDRTAYNAGGSQEIGKNRFCEFHTLQACFVALESGEAEMMMSSYL